MPAKSGLVLGRRRDESIVLRIPGLGDITILVTDIIERTRHRAASVRLLVAAPDAVKILRSELPEAKQ